MGTSLKYTHVQRKTLIYFFFNRKLEMAPIADYEVPLFIQEILKDQIEFYEKRNLLR